MPRYIAFLHEDNDPGIGISFPDFPGCISHGNTVDEAIDKGTEALAFHVSGMREDGEEIACPRSVAEIEADQEIVDWRKGATLAYIPLVEDRGTVKRVNVTLDPGLLSEIDAAARARNMTRSSFLASAARRELLGV